MVSELSRTEIRSYWFSTTVLNLCDVYVVTRLAVVWIRRHHGLRAPGRHLSLPRAWNINSQET